MDSETEFDDAMSMMEIDLALADTYSMMIEAQVEFDSERHRELVYMLLRESFLRGQKVVLDRIGERLKALNGGQQ